LTGKAITSKVNGILAIPLPSSKLKYSKYMPGKKFKFATLMLSMEMAPEEGSRYAKEAALMKLIERVTGSLSSSITFGRVYDQLVGSAVI
jgi:hypothetical protein